MSGVDFDYQISLPLLSDLQMPPEDAHTRRTIEEFLKITSKGVYASSSTSRQDTDLILCARCFIAGIQPIFTFLPQTEVSVDFWKRQMRTNNRELWIDLAAFVTQYRDEPALLMLGLRLLIIDRTCNMTSH